MDQPALARLGRAALPIVALLVFVVGRRRRSVVSPATRSASTSSPITRPRSACSTASRCTTCRFQTTGGFGLFYYPPTFAPLHPAVRRCCRRRRRSGPGSASSIAVVRRRRRGPAGVAHGPLVDRAAGRVVVAVRLRGQARPGRADPLPAVRDRLALARRPDPARARAPRSGAAIKLQPGLILVWALLTRRSARSWSGAVVAGGPGGRRHAARRGRRLVATSRRSSGQVSDPITTPAQLHARRGRVPARASRPSWRRCSSSSARSLVVGRGRRRGPLGDRRGVVPRRRHRQPARSRRSCGTTTRCCCCCRSPTCCAAGRWWAVAHPARDGRGRSSASRQPIVYPLLFWVDARRDARGRDPRAPGGRRVSARDGLDRRAASTAAWSSGWSVVGVVGGHLLAREPRLRRRPRRLLLPRRRVPARPDVADVPARAVRRDPRRRAVLRPVRAVPGHRAHAARRRHRGGDGATRSSRASTPCSRPPASGCAGGCSARIGVRTADRPAWLTVLFGFSTQILWVTTRGGVWHTGHLIATILTFACLIELWGRQRAWLIGLLAGAAFLTRAPLAFAIPFYALMLDRARPSRPQRRRRLHRVGARPWRCGVDRARRSASLPSIVAFFAYNQVRFGIAARVRLCAGDAARRSSRRNGRSGSSRSPTSR